MTETEECWDIPESTPTSATAPAGLNALLAEEVGWVQALDVASREQGIPPPTKFMLASWAIQAKGDVKKALTRMGNYRKVEEKYRLSEISYEDATAWAKRTFPTMNYGAGENKDGLFVYGARGAERDISKMKSEEDWRYLLKNMLINIQSATPTLSDVRKGMGVIINMKGVSLMSYNREFEKRSAELTTNAYPVKMKVIYMLNPPSFFGVLLGFAKMLFSAKALSRIKTMPTEECTEADALYGGQLSQYIEQAQLPPDLGGTCTEDWFDQREQRYAVHNRSVLELAGDQN